MPSKASRSFFLNHLLFTISIRSRLLLYFIALIIIPTSIISITMYYNSTSIITKKTNTSLEEKLNIINANILQKIESINGIATEIYLNPDFIRIISSQHPQDKTQVINEMSTLNKLLENKTVTSIGQNLLVPRVYIFNRPEYLLYSFSDKVTDISVIEKDKWYINLPHMGYAVAGLNSVNISSQTIPTVKFAKRLFGLDDMRLQFSGVLTIDVSMEFFNDILSNSKPTTGTSTFILDKDRTVVASPDTTLLGKDLHQEKYVAEIMDSTSLQYGSFIEKQNHDDILVAYRRVAPLNWIIISLVPISELNGELISFNRIIYLVITVSSILALFFALLLSDNISYPIRKLVNSMKIVQNGEFDISLEYKRNDEFAYLFNAYKRMVQEIKDLINKLYVSEVNKKEAELKSLQAQINPHFLYNTLDSVNWMALELGAKNISIMVTSLSNFFRYSLNKGKSVISLGDEKLQVESYLKIQQIRFQEKLNYEIDFSNDILTCFTVKLILQPLVENSILHGINKRRGMGMITITGKKADSLIEITISDDGIGADVDELNSILDDKNSTASFAIKNVNERIKHYFGDEYGIRYYNNPGPGIMAVLRFPAVKKMEALN